MENIEEPLNLEQSIEAGEEAAEDFAQPGDEDFNEEVLHESIEETIERTKKALGDKSGTGDGQDGTTDQKAQSSEGQPQAGAAKVTQGGEPLVPPQRVTADFREWYKTAPPEMQQQFNKIVGDLENGQRQKLREIHEYRQTVEPIFQAVQPWAKDWQTRGISLPQGVALLAKTHERMLENSSREIARLIKDNDVSLEDVQAYLDGREPNGQQNGNGTGYNVNIAEHPEVKALRQELELIKNERVQSQVQLETDKIRALRDTVDANGNKPYEHILSPQFLQSAQPLVSALRTPPRDPATGQFTGPPLGLVEAYKKAYSYWAHENGITPVTQATSHQSRNTQPQRQQAEPVSMRPRSAPSGTPLDDTDPAKYRNESVEDTMNRVLAQMRG